MGTPLVPLVLAGAAVVLLSSSKKKKSARKGGTLSYKPPASSEIPQIYSGGAAPVSDPGSQSSWAQRQEALQAISQIEFFAPGGGSVSLCAKCHPGTVDGKPGSRTRSAIRAFQAISGLEVDGEWDENEDRAMHRILNAVSRGVPISCDPLLGYPAPFACFVQEGGGFGLMLVEGEKSSKTDPIHTPEPAPSPSQSEYGDDDLLVADAECNYILHQSDKWFIEQQRRCIEYALADMTDGQAAGAINESMLADYIPLCLSLGRDGVGQGVRQFWDANAGWINSLLQKYEILPELLEEDAIKFGLL